MSKSESDNDKTTGKRESDNQIKMKGKSDPHIPKQILGKTESDNQKKKTSKMYSDNKNTTGKRESDNQIKI